MRLVKFIEDFDGFDAEQWYTCPDNIELDKSDIEDGYKRWYADYCHYLGTTSRIPFEFKKDWYIDLWKLERLKADVEVYL